MGRIAKTEGGLSLIEVVFALGLFSLCLLAVIRMAAEVIKTHQIARDHMAALSLARNKMEEMKSVAYEAISDTEEEMFDGDGAGGVGNFTCRVRVSDQTDPRCKTVEVSVSWGPGACRAVVLGSIIAPQAEGDGGVDGG